MFVHNIDPVLFSFWKIQIRYYGIIYSLGLLSTYLYLMYIATKKEIPNLTKKKVEDLMVGIILSVVIGARIFHVFIYNFNYYLANPIEIFQVWKGGLSFHGGLLFTVIWCAYFAKKNKIQFLRITDALVVPAALFLSLGRIANFINGELRGVATTLSIGVKYKGEDFARLPTQLFESLKNFIIFLFLGTVSIFKNKLFKKYVPGLLSAIFLITYGFLRFFIEFFKEGTKIFFDLNIAQILSIITFIVGIIIYKYLSKYPDEIKTKIKKKKKQNGKRK